MKKLFIILAAVLLTASVFAQAPKKMSYQAVVRDVNANLVTSFGVGMQISILQGSPNGTAVYVETHAPTTNANGLVSIEIGEGAVVSGDFATINWAKGSYFIKTETDPTGGSAYSITGTSQLMSVPYALYAETSGSSLPGPQGPRGPVGADGATGPVGADGAIGPAGPVGAAGVDGLDGATGASGPQGPAGLDGADGVDGLDGATGPMGPQGPAGLNGAAGVDGLDGATGASGPQGPAGLDGADGVDGLDGATGPQGPAGTYTAGTGIDITGGVISSTGSSAAPEYAYAYIGNSSTLGAQSLTSMFPAATYVNGVVMNGSSITLHAGKMYEVTVAFYIYNASGGHTYKMKDATNSAYLGTEIYFGQGGSDISYNMSTTNFLFKPTTDVILELEKTQGTDVNLIGKIVVKELK
jgi:hypothetical protein